MEKENLSCALSHFCLTFSAVLIPALKSYCSAAEGRRGERRLLSWWCCSPPGSSVHGVSQARRLEWVAVSFSRGPSRPRDQRCISLLYCRQILYRPSHQRLSVLLSVQFSSVAQSCPTLCDPMNRSTPSPSIHPSSVTPCPSPSPGVHSNSRPSSR